MERAPLICPFCGEGDFDAVGLKMHLAFGWCEPYQNIDLRAALEPAARDEPPPRDPAG